MSEAVQSLTPTFPVCRFRSRRSVTVEWIFENEGPGFEQKTFFAMMIFSFLGGLLTFVAGAVAELASREPGVQFRRRFIMADTTIRGSVETLRALGSRINIDKNVGGSVGEPNC